MEGGAHSILFGPLDVEALVDCHIPITLLNRSKKFVEKLVPLVLALDAPLGVWLS